MKGNLKERPTPKTGSTVTKARIEDDGTSKPVCTLTVYPSPYENSEEDARLYRVDLKCSEDEYESIREEWAHESGLRDICESLGKWLKDRNL